MNVCAACGAENRAGRKFCARCGTALGITCPACGTANEPGELYCGECGTALASPAPSPSPEAASVSGEKKQITVLFADVAGSMDLQERLDAEVWAQIMGRFVSILAEGVRRFGGTVDKFTGDGIMALFGAPLAQEDHARRACHAAWELIKAIGDYSNELRHDQGIELHVRLGLNSGEVVVGRVGDDVTLDPTALGHTVGLAQRMESLAEPGSAYLTEHTARLVEGWFQLRDLGLKPVKGARDLLHIYVLEGPASAPPTLHGAGLGIAPLVGRGQELAVLEDALAAAADGQTQVVGVLGDAGVGKSRLCEEFNGSVAARGITVRRTTGVSHGREVPLLPILALLRDYFGITEPDSADEARAKIRGRVLDLDPDLDETLTLLFDFLEVSDPGRPAPQLVPEMRMRRIFDALRRLTQRRSEREVLVLVVEDLHWFDPQSDAFLERLIESFPGSRTLVVANFRPEYSARWMRHSYYRQLPLAPLQDSAVGELLGGLLGVDFSLAPLLRFVQDRTGGNPFFVEELVRALVEDGTLAGAPGCYRLTRPLHELKVPPTVQAVLAARIDRLSSEHKAVLQTAAVIGRSFDAAVLARVSELVADVLDDALTALSAAELLQEVKADPTVEYRFWHPLTQEVAYGSLLVDRRQKLHGAVARAMVELQPERLDERASLVASHFERSGDRFEAARWEDRAATWSFRRDLGEAVRRWENALEYLGRDVHLDDGLRLAVRIRTQLIRIGTRVGMDTERTAALYREGKAMAVRLREREPLTLVEFSRGLELFVRGNTGEAWERFSEAARLGMESGDAALEAVTCVFSLVSSYVGPLSDGFRLVEHVERATAGDPDVGSRYLGYSPLVRSAHYRAELTALSGRVADAYTDADRALRQVRDRGDSEGVGWVLSFLGRLDNLSGEDHGGQASAREAARIAEESGNRALRVVSLVALGVAQTGSGSYREAVSTLDDALVWARSHGAGLFEEGRLLAHLARAHLGEGDRDSASARAEEAVEVARHQRARIVECLALLTRAEVMRTTGRTDGAEADLAAALALARETGALTYEPFIREELGRLKDDEAELREALRLYRQIGAAGHASRLEAELSERSVR